MVKDLFVNLKHLRKTKHTHNPVDDVKRNAEALLQIKEQYGLKIGSKSGRGATGMSFVHYEVVRHFDPRDPIAFGYPSHPKPQRPIDPDSVSRVLALMPRSLDHIISITNEG